MSSVTFSIIMPVFNAVRTLNESVLSVLDQTFTDFELIIVDDCSVDGSRESIKLFAEMDNRIRTVFLERNSGVANARNAAIKCSEGSYIAFLDADDVWMRDKLLRQNEFFSNGADVVYSDFIRFYEDGHEKTVCSPDFVDFKKMLSGNCIGNLTGAYNTRTLGKVYQESIGHEDYLMWLQIFRRGVVAKRVPEVLARYRVLNSSLSANKFKALLWTFRIYKDKMGLGLLSSIYYLFKYAIGAMLVRV
ncbi:glycosyltransferase family 2 protein [Pseudomonas sp. NFACC08-1]|uniref:glycosyltransferase family 2 protein n=1 Tax=Pseudomonas sp. NFACC08-1 TaxID=1566238 RepID=UPI0008944D45|nr:glycosyltransferase family 2 protein [Pseudomonas sp. NFACC08-1]SDX22528.1 Glycosyltransferase involved in cell wall bisynthesis [Pseudomonas sp. NFACC08-1]